MVGNRGPWPDWRRKRARGPRLNFKPLAALQSVGCEVEAGPKPSNPDSAKKKKKAGRRSRRPERESMGVSCDEVF